jgi:hypothetical protein
MGVMLYVRRCNGVEAMDPSVTPALAQQVYASFPWEAEVATWLALSPDLWQDHRPEMRFVDDAGRILMLTVLNAEFVGFAYQYPILEAPDGTSQSGFNTDRLPRAEAPGLIDLFFADDHQPIYRLVKRYPRSGVSGIQE